MGLPREIEDKFERVLALLLNHGYQETADLVRDIRDYCALTEALTKWQPIETAPKTPADISPQSGWLQGKKHGPAILVSFWGAEDGQTGYEKWPSDVGWWQPHTDCRFCKEQGMDGCWRFLEDDGGHDVQPTHWMPLPDPRPNTPVSPRGTK